VTADWGVDDVLLDAWPAEVVRLGHAGRLVRARRRTPALGTLVIDRELFARINGRDPIARSLS
jgi:hypothetical protein